MSRNSAALGRPHSSRDFLVSLSRKFFPISPHHSKCSITKRMNLTVDPPGRFSFAYFAFFLFSLLSAAAPSDSDDLGKILELQGCARAISRSTLQPLSACLSVCLSVCLSRYIYFLFKSNVYIMSNLTQQDHYSPEAYKITLCKLHFNVLISLY